MIIGWDISRFERSMKEFVHFLSDMDDKEIGVIAVKNRLDITSSTGRIVKKMVEYPEEWNRQMFIERTNAGLARTVARGSSEGVLLCPASRSRSGLPNSKRQDYPKTRSGNRVVC